MVKSTARIRFEWEHTDTEYIEEKIEIIAGCGLINNRYADNTEIIKLLLNEGTVDIEYYDENTKLICDGMVFGYISALRVLESYWRS